jgi:hypothetical protein
VLDSYRDGLDDLTGTPVALRRSAEAAGAPEPGEWTAEQIVGHMAVVEQLWFDRLTTLVRSTNPTLTTELSEAGKAINAKVDGADLETCLQAFNTGRGEVISLLMGLSLRDWERSGTHPTRGELSIADVVDDIATHDQDHLQQLQKMAAAS